MHALPGQGIMNRRNWLALAVGTIGAAIVDAAGMAPQPKKQEHINNVWLGEMTSEELEKKLGQYVEKPGTWVIGSKMKR